MKLEQMYQEVILDHYRRPHHSGLRDPFGAEVHHVNPTCGDELTLRLQLSDDQSTIEDISYDAQGCSISQASTSMMAELLVGRPVSESLEVFEGFHTMISSRGQDEGDEELLDDAVALAGVSRYPARVKCALLGWMAFKDALAQQTEHQE
ncbi:SUF system NifU family Fe-S cluster assembly protein [Dietzia aerolata]|uniref:Fe-S cluster assembly sulfur transfer protein SufU n=1 Tax=Dietzia aerolata TaxID=595984 RepID=A0ABV5JW81_9ACTN|nr:SUF system NifU family Fe-S cluster assembly protein [Dietzia aerolata]MBB0969807.1 SUF system NifU family Fe-S cluster assembly protein [Dietzia aerolata]HIW68299.1 SUF system NifU family Fe-S cluster assembly protein [Candidatus Dietzia merdigallinarum]